MESPASAPPSPLHDTDEGPDSERVLIVAPVGRDAELVRAALRRDGVHSVICTNAAAFRRELDRGAGALLLTQEALVGNHTILDEALARQPSWSDLPLILLVSPVTTRADREQANQLLAMHATVLERPIRVPTLISVIRSALRARARQHEVRSLVHALNESNATLEDRVLERTAEVRALVSSLTLAEQRERNRLSDLLHDHLQQLLFAVQMKLQVLGNAAVTTRQRELLTQTEELLGDAMRTVRTLTVELHPPVLSEDGLTVALDWMATHMHDQYGLTVEVETPGPCLLPSKEMLILLTQSVKELLFNVVKHAETNRARVVVETRHDRLQVWVSDEGRGFDPTVFGETERGHGLYALRERLLLLGGSLQAESAPGEGTSILLDVPVPAADPGLRA